MIRYPVEFTRLVTESYTPVKVTICAARVLRIEERDEDKSNIVIGDDFGGDRLYVYVVQGGFDEIKSRVLNALPNAEENGDE